MGGRTRRAIERRCRRQAGSVTVTIVLALAALLAAAALAIDVGLVWTARAQLQNAVDAAALAGATELLDADGCSTGTASDPQAIQAARDIAAAHHAAHADSIALADGDIVLGHWDAEARTFAPGMLDVNAVEVTGHLDADTNGAVPTVMARMVGRADFDVRAQAIALADRGVPVLPIAVDCCKLRGPSCSADYCPTLIDPPNACNLALPQSGAPRTVSCLEFPNRSPRNACYTNLDDDDSRVSVSDLRSILGTCTGSPVHTGDRIYLTDGVRANDMAEEIYDRFHTRLAYSGMPGGKDRYGPLNGVADSWVVALPVVECQSSELCRPKTLAQITEFVCFEVREISGPPFHEIKGRFLCPSDPLYALCGFEGGSGSEPTDVASQPVLVR